MSWIVTPALARLMQDFRTRFPHKSREQDGTIGDAAHQKEKSGHNPDDTPGVVAEYSDADSIPEVRADDIDSRLNDEHGATMLDVIRNMLVTPADLARLKYIIHLDIIWSRTNGWQAEHYSGNYHGFHGHFSGDPDHDNNDAPWLSVLNFGGNMAGLSDRNLEQISNADTYLWKLITMSEQVPGILSNGTPNTISNDLVKTLKRIENTLNNAVTAWHGLPDEEIARIAAQLARETDAATVESALRGVLSGAKVTWDSPAT